MFLLTVLQFVFRGFAYSNACEARLWQVQELQGRTSVDSKGKRKPRLALTNYKPDANYNTASPKVAMIQTVKHNHPPM